MRILLAILIGLTSLTTVVAQEDAKTARQRHQWGRFPIGAWKRMRIRKETYDDEGKVAGTSIEESQTTLVKADDKQFTLELITQVKAAGEDLHPQKKHLSLTYYGAAPMQQAIVKTLDDEASVELEGQSVKCRVLEIKVESESMRRVTKQHLSDGPMPLRQETVVMTPEDGTVVVQTTSNMLLQNVMHMVLNEQRAASLIQTSVRRRDTIQHTVEMHCGQVPGGVVTGWTKITNGNGELKERIYIELIDFRIPSE